MRLKRGVHLGELRDPLPDSAETRERGFVTVVERRVRFARTAVAVCRRCSAPAATSRVLRLRRLADARSRARRLENSSRSSRAAFSRSSIWNASNSDCSRFHSEYAAATGSRNEPRSRTHRASTDGFADRAASDARAARAARPAATSARRATRRSRACR